jgi:cytochrome c-type biogenesis protein CcmH
MLGRSYAVLGRHGEAAPALKRAVALRGDDAVLLADCADALAVVNGRNLDGEPIRMVERALKIDPNNIKALSLAGTHAFNHQDYGLALKHWEKMAQLAPNDEMVRQVQGGMEEARKLAGGTTALPGKLVARP